MQRVEASRILDTDALPDAELVGLARQGNGSAFRAIMQRHNRRLYRVAMLSSIGLTRDTLGWSGRKGQHGGTTRDVDPAAPSGA